MLAPPPNPPGQRGFFVGGLAQLGSNSKAIGKCPGSRHILAALVSRANKLFSVAAISALSACSISAATDQELSAEQTYDRFCLACHGVEGDGNGPAAPLLWPAPRDFTKGRYKWRSTPSGSPPTDADLAKTIRLGVAGTSMHGFGDVLSERQITDLVAYLKSFAPKRFRNDAVALELPARAQQSAPKKGKKLFSSMGCARCHGNEGRGNGPAAETLRTGKKPAHLYDLTKTVLRRPHVPGEEVSAIYTSIASGLMGTPMPAYDGTPSEDLWAVANYVAGLMPNKASTPPTNGNAAVAENLPQRGMRTKSSLFQRLLPPQGPPPDSLAPAQASLHANQCGRCHASQKRQWQRSFHAGAGSPGLIAQLLPRENVHGARFVGSCQRCHAPLAEQSPYLPDKQKGAIRNSQYDSILRDEGINCAGCHVRNWERHGPPRNPSSGLLALPGYPFRQKAVYERSDFCMDCHQLGPETAVNGKPRLNTYREWLEGPYMRRGIQCQHCHMPNRDHTWKGVHDPETFRQGIEVRAKARLGKDESVRVVVTMRNVGAGHYLPTTPTPAVWLETELLDEDGDVIGRSKKRIGRHLAFRENGWVELEDSRIPPGELAKDQKTFRDAEDARSVRVRVRVHPDDFYEGFYKSQLRRNHAPGIEAMFEEALATAIKNRYTALVRTFPVSSKR